MLRQVLVQVVRKELRHKVVAECANVTDATAACLEHQPNLVIMDWMLPDGRGFDLIRKLKSKLPNTRWIAISSNEQPELIREAMGLGVHGFVMKRSPIEVLRDAIVAVLAGREYFCPECSRLLASFRTSAAANAGVPEIDLTGREREVLMGFARGESSKEIADRLGISAKTVNNQISLVKQKLGLADAASLVRYAMRRGYVDGV